MAHPIGEGEALVANVARAKRWLRWLYRHYRGYVALAPYLLELEILSLDRDEGLERDILVLRACDVLWLCGGHISPGMAVERHAAETMGKRIIDLTDLGPEPPDGGL